MINTSPEICSLFSTVTHSNGKTETTSFLPADIWHCIAQHLPPFDAVRLRCNLFLASVIPNSFHWDTTVKSLFPKSTYQAKIPFEKFLYNQRIQYNMQRGICSTQVIPCLESDDPSNGGFRAIHLSEQHLFVGSNSGLVEWFDRKNGEKAGEICLNFWKDRGYNAPIQSLKEMNGILYAQVMNDADDGIRLCLIDLSSKKICFQIDKKGTAKLPFFMTENALYILSESNIEVYDLNSNQLQKKITSFINKEKKEFIRDFTIDQKQNLLYILDLNTAGMLKIKVFDLKNETTLKTDTSENPLEVNLSHLYDLETEFSHACIKSQFDGSELFITSLEMMNGWKINIENKCLSPILELNQDGGWQFISDVSEDYLLTSDGTVQQIYKQNGPILRTINQPTSLISDDRRRYIAGQGACLAITCLTTHIDYQKTQDKAKEMFEGKTHFYNPTQYTHYSTVEILNFDVDIPEDRFSKVLDRSKKEIEHLGANCEKTFEETTKQVEETVSMVVADVEKTFEEATKQVEEKCSIQ